MCTYQVIKYKANLKCRIRWSYGKKKTIYFYKIDNRKKGELRIGWYLKCDVIPYEEGDKIIGRDAKPLYVLNFYEKTKTDEETIEFKVLREEQNYVVGIYKEDVRYDDYEDPCDYHGSYCYHSVREAYVIVNREMFEKLKDRIKRGMTSGAYI